MYKRIRDHLLGKSDEFIINSEDIRIKREYDSKGNCTEDETTTTTIYRNGKGVVVEKSLYKNGEKVTFMFPPNQSHHVSSMVGNQHVLLNPVHSKNNAGMISEFIDIHDISELDTEQIRLYDTHRKTLWRTDMSASAQYASMVGCRLNYHPEGRALYDKLVSIITNSDLFSNVSTISQSGHIRVTHYDLHIPEILVNEIINEVDEPTNLHHIMALDYTKVDRVIFIGSEFDRIFKEYSECMM